MSEFVQIESSFMVRSASQFRTDGPLRCGVLASGNHPHMDAGRVRPVTLCGGGGT
jgi:hypothetical protein